MAAPYTIPGTVVGVANGFLSGISISLDDIAVLYQNGTTNTSSPVGESMVAVFQNGGVSGTSPVFTRVSPPPGGGRGNPLDYDAGTTNPTAIAVGDVSGGAFEDILVASNQGRGFVSVLKASPLPSGPSSTQFLSSAVNIPNPAAVDDLTVTVELEDNQTVSGLSLTLVAPNNAGSLVLFLNANDSTGASIKPPQGLPSSNAVGVYGFNPTSSPGDPIGTIFDDNATRNIFDSTQAGTNGNSAAGNSGYVGFFRPEGGSLKQLLQQIGPGNINGTWKLIVTNFSSTTPAGGTLLEFKLDFSTGMTKPVQPTVINDEFQYFYGTNQAPMTTDVEIGSLTDVYPTAAPSTPQGIGPGMVFAEDNTLGPDSPFQGRIYATFVGYFDVITPATNPTTNTDIFLVSSDDGGQTWSSPVLVNDDQGITDGTSGANDSNTNPNADITGRSQYMPELAVDQSTGTLVISWRDARDDAADARVATYITTSIDGGQTFGPQTYANPTKTAVDAITGATNVIGPASDNESAVNAQTDARYGYGNQMGLAVANGQLFPIWAGNFFGPSGDPQRQLL